MATPFGSASQVGSFVGPALGQGAGATSARAARRRPGCPASRRRTRCCQAACASWPRATTLRACSMTSGATSKVFVRVEAEDLLGGRDLVVAQRRAVRGAGVLLVRRGPADDRAQHDDRRAAGLGLGGGERGVDGGEVLAVVDVLHVPAVGLVALADVLGEGDVRVVLDGDLVVVVDEDEVAQLLGAGDRRRLAAHALLEVTVGGEAQMVWSNRLSPSAASGSNRPRSRRAAIAMPTALPTPWPSGPVVVSTPWVWLHLGVAGGQRAPGAQRLEVGQLQAVAGEVELDVEGQARVAHRQHEAVAADPVRVARVVLQPLLEEQVGGGGHAHRRARVAVADLLDGVHGQHAGGVDRAAVELAEALGERRVRLGRAAGGGVGGGLGGGLGPGALRSMWSVLPRDRPVRARWAVRWAPGRRGPGGAPSSSTVGPTRCTRSINAVNPSRPRSCRADGRTGRGLQWPRFPSPVRRRLRACCPRASRTRAR